MKDEVARKSNNRGQLSSKSEVEPSGCLTVCDRGSNRMFRDCVIL